MLPVTTRQKVLKTLTRMIVRQLDAQVSRQEAGHDPD